MKEYKYELLRTEQYNLINELVYPLYKKYILPTIDINAQKKSNLFFENGGYNEKFLIQYNYKVIGCFDDKKLVGVIAYDYRPFMKLLYVDDNYHYQGIATELFKMMMDDLIKKFDNFILKVNASKYAYEAYSKLGFVEEENKINYIKMVYKYEK